MYLSLGGWVLPVLGFDGAVHTLDTELGVSALLCAGLRPTASEVCLQVVEDHPVTGNHNAAQQREEPPVLYVNPTVGIYSKINNHQTI